MSDRDEIRVSLDELNDALPSQDFDSFEYPALDKPFGEPVIVMHHVSKGSGVTDVAQKYHTPFCTQFLACPVSKCN